MADDKSKRRPQDTSCLSLSEDYELRYWTEKFAVSEQELQRAVQAVDNSATKVEEYLRSKR